MPDAIPATKRLLRSGLTPIIHTTPQHATERRRGRAMDEGGDTGDGPQTILHGLVAGGGDKE